MQNQWEDKESLNVNARRRTSGLSPGFYHMSLEPQECALSCGVLYNGTTVDVVVLSGVKVPKIEGDRVTTNNSQ